MQHLGKLLPWVDALREQQVHLIDNARQMALEACRVFVFGAQICRKQRRDATRCVNITGALDKARAEKKKAQD